MWNEEILIRVKEMEHFQIQCIRGSETRCNIKQKEGILMTILGCIVEGEKRRSLRWWMTLREEEKTIWS